MIPALKVMKLDPEAKLPEVAHPYEDFGYDVFSNETVIIPAGEQKLVKTGIAYEMDSIVLGQIVLKMGIIAKQPSGVAKKRFLDVKAGVLDAGWRGEIGILLYNYGNQEQVIYPKDKIAQVVPIPVFTSRVIEVNELSDSQRGEFGWGSNHKTVSVVDVK